MFDAALALLLAILVLADLWRLLTESPDLTNPLPHVVLALLQTVPVAWRRRWPLTVLLLVAAAVAAPLRTDVGFIVGFNFQLLSVLVCIYTVAAYGDRRRVGVAAFVAASGPLILSVPSGLDPISWIVFVGAWVLGRVARRGWESKARRAVEQERLQLARELHDIVAHGVTVIAVQAGAARMNLEARPDLAREALASIESTSRQSLVEMRRLLGLLKPQEGQAPTIAPQPSLEGLEVLIKEVHEAGLEVEMRIEGQVRPLPAALDLSAFRIVQEALTNSLKHAGPTRAQVVLRYRPDELEVEVLDEGGPAEASMPARDGCGQGLVGMGERVALFGGHLEARPRPGGGFQVKARLPSETIEP